MEEKTEKFQWYKTGYHEVIYQLIDLKNQCKSAEEFGNLVKGYLYGICDYKDMQIKFENTWENT